MPARRQRPGLCLAVADDAEDDEITVVECRPERVDEGVAQLAAFVDRPRRLRRHVAADPTGEREAPEQVPQPRGIKGQRRIDLTGGALEVGVGDRRRPAVPGSDDPDRIEVPGLDDPTRVDVDEIEAAASCPNGRAGAA